MNSYVILLYLFIALIGIYIIAQIYLTRKRMRISKKTVVYNKMLNEAKSTRMKYIKSLETTDNYKIKLDGMRVELQSEKTKINRLRSELRELLQEIKQRQSAKRIDKVEAKVIEQQKVNFGGHWKVLDNFRKQFNKRLASFRMVEEENRIHTKKAKSCITKWDVQKNVLMGLYDELREDVNLPDPKALLCADK